MPDELDVSGGGTAVTTEDLESSATQLERLTAESAECAAVLRRLEVPTAAGFNARQAAVDIEVAAANLEQLASRSQQLVNLLVTAARSYVVTERVVSAGVRSLESQLAGWLGSFVPGLVISSSLLTSVAGGVWAGIAAGGGLGGVFGTVFKDGGIPKASPTTTEYNRLITNSTTVSAVRALVQASGPFVAGATGAPTGGLDGTAKGIVLPARSLGLFDETPVKLVESRPLPTTRPPADYVDRLARVPYGDDEPGPQVVIEKYAVPGESPRFEVYVGGTVTFSPVATTEPWDMTSNMMNAAGDQSGSVASVRAAMAAAGIDEGSPVQFTGYSQGGGTAARLAASGLYNTQGLVTFGGPTGQVPLPDTFPAVLVEHSDDLVPALGGEQDNRAAVLVRRDVFGGENLPQQAVPAHHIEYYLQTARLMDASGSAQLDATIARLDSFTEGATLESSTAYRFERVGGG
ncbi:MAG: hypothetical protein KF761_14770 [Salinibacterium sp.]|nr:hypothetical protein [Salinibacterium sp.]